MPVYRHSQTHLDRYPLRTTHRNKQVSGRHSAPRHTQTTPCQGWTQNQIRAPEPHRCRSWEPGHTHRQGLMYRHAVHPASRHTTPVSCSKTRYPSSSSVPLSRASNLITHPSIDPSIIPYPFPLTSTDYAPCRPPLCQEGDKASLPGTQPLPSHS